MKKTSWIIIFILILAVLVVYLLFFCDSCKKLLGAKDNKTSLCQNVTSIERDICYEKAAEEREDISICDEITEKSNVLKYRCYSNIAAKTQDVLICDKIPKNESIECYTGVAYASGEMSICNKISTDDYLGKLSNGRCLMQVAVKIDNRETCYKLEIQTQKNYCLNHTNNTQV